MPSRRSRRPKGQGGLLRADLLASAERILAAEGDGKRLSIRAVASGAGVTPPSVYRHFNDKAELLRAVVQARFEAFDAFLDAATSDTAPPCEQLRRRCHAYLEFARSQPASYRLLFSATELGPEALGTEGVDWHPGAPSFFRLVDSVGRCLTSRRPHDAANAMFVAMLVWTQLHGIADLQLSKPELPWPAATELIDHALVGLDLLDRPTPAKAAVRRRKSDR
ncbi:MAG: TetR/AcrR family transcriptional regulator [Acidimicrobiaceae bacterium]|nr:TetR/AcrR family transcriptional regulator [Acidimicrobiaceae bacterium]